MNQEIETVAASCRQDATTVLNANEKLSKHMQEYVKKLDECQGNSPKPKLARGISELTRFQKGFHQIFGWSVSFLIWPLALHDPESHLGQILSQTSGIQIKRGLTRDTSWLDMRGAGRRSDCVMVVIFVDSGQLICMGESKRENYQGFQNGERFG